MITVKCSWENLGGKYTGVHHEAISICIPEIFCNSVRREKLKYENVKYGIFLETIAMN